MSKPPYQKMVKKRIFENWKEQGTITTRRKLIDYIYEKRGGYEDTEIAKKKVKNAVDSAIHRLKEDKVIKIISKGEYAPADYEPLEVKVRKMMWQEYRLPYELETVTRTFRSLYLNSDDEEPEDRKVKETARKIALSLLWNEEIYSDEDFERSVSKSLGKPPDDEAVKKHFYENLESFKEKLAEKIAEATSDVFPLEEKKIFLRDDGTIEEIKGEKIDASKEGQVMTAYSLKESVLGSKE